MAKLIQRRRGTTAEHNVFTGAIGEITHDTTKHTLVIHDDTTAGGHALAREDLSNVDLNNKIGIAELDTSDGANGQVLTTDGSGTINFRTVDTSVIAVGGDLSGTVSNAQIIANAVGISEINVTDGTAGQVLTTNGSGNLSFAHPTLSGDISGTLANAQIVAGSVGNQELATDAVSAIKIADGGVTSAKIATGAVTTTTLADLNVTTGKLADLAVTDSKVATDAIRTQNVVDGNITSAKLAPAGTMPAWDGTALTNLPYDIAFIAGFDTDLLKEDIKVGTYGEMVMARAGTFLGEGVYIDTAPTGAAAIMDVEKNGTTIYSTKPQIAAGANTVTAGVLSVTSFAANDRITFKVTQIGSTAAGEGLRFTMKCKV